MANTGASVEVVAVGLDAGALWGGDDGVLRRLAVELGPPDGERLIFLPPLVANLLAYAPETRGMSLEDAARGTARARRRRRLAVQFAYPGARAQRRVHLVNHDRVHRALRGSVAQLAQDASATLVAGTAVLDHPRSHWEDWPDTGHLFHGAWSFSADTEPTDTLRNNTPTWRVLEGLHADPSRPRDRPALRTALGPVDVLWSDNPRASQGSGPVVWAPRAWLKAGTGREDSPAMDPTRLLGDGVRVAVRTCLSGQVGGPLEGETFIAMRRADDLVVSQMAGPPVDGLSWCRTTVSWPWDKDH